MSKKQQRELVQACLLGDAAAVARLLTGSGLDPDAVTVDDAGDTPLMFAIRRADTSLVRVLVERGARLDRANAAGDTPLTLVARSTSDELRTFFDVRGTQLPLDIGVRFFDVLDRVVAGTTAPARVLSLLVLVDPQICRAGQTPLHVLAEGSFSDDTLYTALLDAGVDIDAIDATGATALHHAAARGLLAVTHTLLAAGASFEHRDREGQTPLHRAARSRTSHAAAIVAALLARGASATALDADDLRPADGATPRVAELLAEVPGASPRGDLELELRRRFTREHLAIYADQLQQEGDPRGELIALDLEPKPSSGSWRERRHARCEDWIGASTDLHAFERMVRFGFVLHLDDIAGRAPGKRPGRSRLAEAILATPAGGFLRSFAVWGASERVTAALWSLARRRCSWLDELLIAPTERKLAPDLIAALIEATPNLDTLYVIGPDVMVAFDHPTLRRCFVSLPRTITVPPRTVVHFDSTGDTIPSDVVLDALEAIDATATRERVLDEYGAVIPDLPRILAAFERDGVTRYERGERADGPLTALGRALRTKQLRLPLHFGG